MLLGKTLVGVRTTDLPGTLISAIEDARRDPTWQTEVAAPLPADPLLPGPEGKLTVVTAGAAMFRIDVRGLANESIVDRPLLAVIRGELARPVASVVPMPGRMFAMIPEGEPDQIVLFDPKEEQRRFRWLLVPDSVMACPPIAWAGGLLAPCKNGRVLLFDPQSTESLAEPFEPELEGLSSWTWRQPVAVDSKEAVLSDGDKRLYRLAVDSSHARPRLVALGEGKAAAPIASPLAVAGKVVYAADTTGTLRCFSLPSLDEGKTAQARRLLRVGSAGLRPPRPAGHRQGPPGLPRRPAKRALADRSSLWSAGRSALGRRQAIHPGVSGRRGLARGRIDGRRVGQGRDRLSVGQRRRGSGRPPVRRQRRRLRVRSKAVDGARQRKTVAHALTPEIGG